MTELETFKAMLERAGVGHGVRDDHNPAGTAILVEAGESEAAFTVTEFGFDAAGQLRDVASYPGEVG